MRQPIYNFRWTIALCLLVATGTLSAHAVSMSTGELHVDGRLAVYELRIPLYEVTHVANPETALMEHLRLSGARRMTSECRTEADTYVCTANYQFPGAADYVVDSVDVECTLYQITVPNHVHLLRVIQGSKSEQVVFDQTATRAEVRFRPLSQTEVFLRSVAEGMWRAIASPAALFLIALVVAARSGPETVVFAVMYFAGEWLMRSIAPRIPWPLAPRFVEAAMALTVAYLAVELLTLPKAGMRWAVILVLGLFHGLYFAPFPVAYLTGAVTIQAALIAILGWSTMRWSTPALRRVAAVLLLVGGAAWFISRLVQAN